jgi:type IV pilus assembly protein PilO
MFGLGKKSTGAAAAPKAAKGAAKAIKERMPRKPPVDFKKMADEFRNLDPKEPGTWPLIPRLAAYLGAIVVVVFLAWWLIWQGQIETLEAKVNEENQLREQWLEKKNKTVNIVAYRNQLAEIDRSFGELLKQLPNKSEMESLLVDINQAGVGRGLQFDLFKPDPEVVKEFYAELPITIKLSGSYHDLGGFAGDLAKLPRIVTLNEINVTAIKSNTSDPKAILPAGALSLSAVAKTFRYLDEAEIAQNKKKAAKK